MAPQKNMNTMGGYLNVAVMEALDWSATSLGRIAAPLATRGVITACAIDLLRCPNSGLLVAQVCGRDGCSGRHLHRQRPRFLRGQFIQQFG